MNADERITKVNSIFSHAMRSPIDYEYDACILDEINDLWDKVLLSHLGDNSLTSEQERNLILAWRFSDL